MVVDQLQRVPRLDIIISVFRLGGEFDGIEAIRLLRSLSGTDVAAFLISCDTSAGMREQVEATGLVLLSRPVIPGKLWSLLRHLALKKQNT
jgi:CheY-like chemotaxis protein